MTEPKRLLDSKGAPSDMTRLLRAARRDVPPPGLRRRTWQSLAMKSAAAGLAVGASSTVAIHGTALAATATSGASAATGTQALISKGLLLLALKSAAAGTGLGVCALCTHHVVTELTRTDAALIRPSAAPTPKRAAGTAAVKRSPTQRDAIPEPPPASSAADRVAPAEALEAEAVEALPLVPTEPPGEVARKPSFNNNPTAPAKASSSGQAQQEAQFEAQQVAEVRRILRAGDGTTALRSLATIERTIARGVLGQERDALRIDALLLLGQQTEARRLQQRFAERYPRSPLLRRWNW